MTTIPTTPPPPEDDERPSAAELAQVSDPAAVDALVFADLVRARARQLRDTPPDDADVDALATEKGARLAGSFAEQRVDRRGTLDPNAPLAVTPDMWPD